MAQMSERPLSILMLAAFTGHSSILDATNESMQGVRRLKVRNKLQYKVK